MAGSGPSRAEARCEIRPGGTRGGPAAPEPHRAATPAAREPRNHAAQQRRRPSSPGIPPRSNAGGPAAPEPHRAATPAAREPWNLTAQQRRRPSSPVTSPRSNAALLGGEYPGRFFPSDYCAANVRGANRLPVTARRRSRALARRRLLRGAIPGRAILSRVAGAALSCQRQPGFRDAPTQGEAPPPLSPQDGSAGALRASRRLRPWPPAPCLRPRYVGLSWRATAPSERETLT